MKAPRHDTPPPGYIPVTAAAELLGMSRQNFHQAGLVDALPSWTCGRTRVYRQGDVYELRHWLYVRRGLIALGLRAHDYPLNPSRDEFDNAVHEAYWDVDCPVCGGDGVGEPLGGAVWCGEHGIQQQ